MIFALDREKALTTQMQNAVIQEFLTYFLSSAEATEREEQFLGMVVALLPVRSRHFVVHVRHGDVAPHCTHVPSCIPPKKKLEMQKEI